MLKQNNSANFEIESIKSSLWRYFYTFTLVTEDITVIEYNNRDNAFINCAQLSISKTEINDFLKSTNSLNLNSLNLRQKVLNQVFEVILTHLFYLQEI